MSVASAEIPPDFTYVRIPCDQNEPLVELSLNSLHDDKLREEIASYFRTSAVLSIAQEKEAFDHVLKAAKSDTEKLAVQELVSGRESSFEIVPVIMPNRANSFIGCSLYIDEVGRFKELPLNDRASAFAQRDIRGDAFLVRNYDDPCCDTWSRVSTSASEAETILSNIPGGMNSTGDGSPKNAIKESRALTREDIETAQEKKNLGNQKFKDGLFEEARRLYEEAFAELDGRDDFLGEASAVLPTLRQALLLNRGQCSLRLKDYRDSLEASRAILQNNLKHVKAQYMYASSLMWLSEFDACNEVIRTFLGTILPTFELREQHDAKPCFEQLAAEVNTRQIAYHQKQKQMFSGMFSK